jgi:hypothetical protein
LKPLWTREELVLAEKVRRLDFEETRVETKPWQMKPRSKTGGKRVKFQAGFLLSHP